MTHEPMPLDQALALADHASPAPMESIRALRALREHITTLESALPPPGHGHAWMIRDGIDLNEAEHDIEAATFVQPAAAYAPVIDAKYNNVLLPFARMMARELHANADKGDRPGWRQMTPATGMLEIYYHAAKLQKAVKDGDAEGIREYAADVANMSMMLLDVCGGLDVPAQAIDDGQGNH